MTLSRALIVGIVLAAVSRTVHGDTFAYLDEHGKLTTVDARLAGEGQGSFALELPDGELRVVNRLAVVRRVSGDDPEPDAPQAVLERLQERFGKENFRGVAQPPYVIGLVLAEPLPRQFESKAAAFLKKATKFFKIVEGVFLDFMKDVKAETEKPRYPLVILIFETDDGFEEFAHSEMDGRGLSAGAIAGYYNLQSNRLVIRMSECFTFATPLHEAIHQQMYNRVLARLAPLPAWFNEGIATSFEGNGEKVTAGPLKVSKRYSRQAMHARTVNWDDVVADDAAFHGDVLAGEAYGHAWSIHWFLASRYKKDYIRYLQLLGQKRPLEKDEPEARRREFEETFGKTPGQLQQEFPRALELAAQKQNIDLQDYKPPGYLQRMSNLAEVEMTAVQGNVLEVEGQMRNVSTIRPMTFHVTVETEAGTYAEWLVPNLGTLQVSPLPRQIVQKVMANAPGGSSSTFRIHVKAAIPDGETGKAWQRGDLPRPVFRER